MRITYKDALKRAYEALVEAEDPMVTVDVRVAATNRAQAWLSLAQALEDRGSVRFED